MRKQTADIIQDLVDSLVVDFTINNASTVSGNFLLETNCTWWLSIGDTVTIGGSDYVIEEFVINESITVSGALLPVVTTFPVIVPNYIHGTVKMSQNEVDAVLNKEDLVPFVWLFEIVRDRKNTDDESMIERETDLRIFFVNTANSADWLTDDHYTNVIDPMQQMVDLFIEKIKESKFFTEDISFDCIPLVNLSQEGNQDGSLFDCNLSGIELKLFAQIRVDLSCDNKCKCSN